MESDRKRVPRLRQLTNLERATSRKANESWQMFTIMAEFIDAAERLSEIRPAVSIFGSARIKPTDPYYEITVDIARRLSDEGFSVISGGGPGIMEAANKGAYEGSSPSIGLNIELPHEQTKYADAYIVLPGGFGTIDELSEVLVLIQTGKTQRIPVVLVGSKFWEGLLKWFKDTLLANGMVESQDLELVQVIDDPKEIVEAIYHFYESRDIVLSETEHPHQSFL